MTLQTVYHFEQIRRFFTAARRRRVDIAMIGDSNMHHFSSGLMMGFQRAWGRLFGLYATGVHPTQSNGTIEFDYGIYWEHYPVDTAAQATHLKYIPNGDSGTLGLPRHRAENAGLVASGFGFALGWVSPVLQNTHPNGYGHLKWHWNSGTFSTGAGLYQPCIRNPGTAGYMLYGPIIHTNTGTDGLTLQALDIPSGTLSPSDGSYQLCFQGNASAGDTQGDGPFFSMWQRIEWPDIPTGVAVSTLCYLGGQPTKAPAQALQSMTELQFSTWLDMLVVCQNDEPMLLVHVVEGQNDYGDTTMSVGPTPAPGNTADGVADNHAAIVTRVRAAWAAKGYDADNLFFLFGPYHPLDDDKPGWLAKINAALCAYADTETHISVAQSPLFSTSDYFNAKTWYYSGEGDAHLSDTPTDAYSLWCDIAVNLMLPVPAAIVQHTSGEALDLKLFDAAAQVWDVAHRSFSAWDDGSIADYVIAGTELGTSGLYTFALPVHLTQATSLRGDVTVRAGGDPALSDAHAATLDSTDFDGLRQTALNQVDEQVSGIERRATYLDAPVSRAGSGEGGVAVDHNTGGTDALRYMDGVDPVSDGSIRAYVKADYDVGQYAVCGRAVTRADGRWASPIYLNPGVVYTLTFAKPGHFAVTAHDIVM